MPIYEFATGGDVIALCATKCAAEAVWISVYVRKGTVDEEQDRLTRVSRTLAAAGFVVLDESKEEPMHTRMHGDHPLANYYASYKYVQQHDQKDAHKHYRLLTGGKPKVQIAAAFEAISPSIGGLKVYDAN